MTTEIQDPTLLSRYIRLYKNYIGNIHHL